MDKLVAERVHCRDVKASQQCELLQEYRPLTPRTTLQDGMAVVIVADRILDRRRPSSKIIRGQQPTMATPRYVQHIRRAEELIHRLGDETTIPGASRCIDAGLTRVADRLAAD